MEFFERVHVKRDAEIRIPDKYAKPLDAALLCRFISRAFKVFRQKSLDKKKVNIRVICSTTKADGYRLNVKLSNDDGRPNVLVLSSGGNEGLLRQFETKIRYKFLECLPRWMFDWQFEFLVEAIGFVNMCLEDGKLVPNDSNREVGYLSVRTVNKLLLSNGDETLVDGKFVTVPDLVRGQIQFIGIWSYKVPGDAEVSCGLALPKVQELEFWNQISHNMGDFVRDGWDTTYGLVEVQRRFYVFDLGVSDELSRRVRDLKADATAFVANNAAVASNEREFQAYLWRRLKEKGGEGFVLYSGKMKGGDHDNYFFRRHFTDTFGLRFCNAVKVKSECLLLCRLVWCSAISRYLVYHEGKMIGYASKFQRMVGEELVEVPVRFMAVGEDGNFFTGCKYLPFDDNGELPYSKEYIKSVPTTIAECLARNEYWRTVHAEQEKLRHIKEWWEGRCERPKQLFSGKVFFLHPKEFGKNEYNRLESDIKSHGADLVLVPCVLTYIKSYVAGNVSIVQINGPRLKLPECDALIVSSVAVLESPEFLTIWGRLGNCDVVLIEWIKDCISLKTKVDCRQYKMVRGADGWQRAALTAALPAPAAALTAPAAALTVAPTVAPTALAVVPTAPTAPAIPEDEPMDEEAVPMAVPVAVVEAEPVAEPSVGSTLPLWFRIRFLGHSESL